tara:strand:+ start:556 stop:990 length:435 start_codon:yes stop_codon:yes gene_type:complete
MSSEKKSLMQGVKVKDILTEKKHDGMCFVPSTMSIHDVLGVIEERSISSVPVWDMEKDEWYVYIAQECVSCHRCVCWPLEILDIRVECIGLMSGLSSMRRMTIVGTADLIGFVVFSSWKEGHTTTKEDLESLTSFDVSPRYLVF